MSKIFTRKWSEISGGRYDPLSLLYDFEILFKNNIFEIKTIESIALSIKSGFAAGKNAQSVATNGIIQIRPTNINEYGLLKFDKNIYIPDNINQEYYIEQGEVLFNNTNSQELVGKTAVFNMNGQYVCSNHITRIKVDKEDILPEYLTIILNIYQERKVFFNTCINWNNQSGINTEMLKQYKIPVPKINIQQNIIDIMDNAYKLKKEKEGEAKRLLDSIDRYLLDELGIKVPARDTTLKNRIFTRKFSEISGDRFDCSYNQEYYKKLQNNILFNTEYFQIKNLGELLEYIEKGIEVGSENYVQQGIPFIRVSDIDNFGINYHTANKYISYDLYKELKKKFQPKNNELLYSKDGTIGICLKVEDIKECIISGAILRLVFKEELCIDFIQNFLSLSVVQKLINRESIGAVIRHLNIDKFLNLKVPVPPVEIQEKISNEILSRKAKALRLQNEARKLLEEAKYQVENIIFGERV